MIGVKRDVSGICLRYVLSEAQRGSGSTKGPR